jgi:cellulose synthase/poly-beta-1,6-N-acetylglucosamine synthase-like glycosyltransferase/sugar lactone lactonase YvrE
LISGFVSGEKTELNGARDLALGPDDNLYITSFFNNNILKYDGITGEFVEKFVTDGSGGLNGPTDLAFDNGYLYVISSKTNNILKYDGITGEFVETVYQYISEDYDFRPVSPESTMKGMMFDKHHNLYTSSFFTDEIIKFTEAREKHEIFATGGGLDGPTDLAFDKDGNLYVTSSHADQVIKYKSDGTLAEDWLYLDKISKSNGIRNDIRLKNPQGLFFSENNLNVISSASNEIIRKFNIGNYQDGGEIIRVIANPSLAPVQPTHLEFSKNEKNKFCVNSSITGNIECYNIDDVRNTHELLVQSFITPILARDDSVIGPDGQEYFSDNLRNQIRKYDVVENSVQVVANTEKAQLFGPRNIVFDQQENLYVDTNDNQILKFNRFGNFTDILIRKNNGGLDDSGGLAIWNNTKIYASSSNNHKILEYNLKDGKFDRTILSRQNGLLFPTDLIVNNNYLYISSLGNDKIVKYDIINKKIVGQFNTPGPKAIFVDGDTLYSINSDKNQVNKINQTSHESATLNLKEGMTLEDLVLDNNILYVSTKENKIIRYDTTTNVVDFLEISPKAGKLNMPRGLVIHNELMYIVNQDSNEILIQSLNGDKHSSISDEQIHIRPGGITFDRDSNLYVTSLENNLIYKYDIDDGDLLGVFSKYQDKTLFNDGLKNLVFSNDKKELYVTSGNNILRYNGTTGYFLDSFSTDGILKYPKDLVIDGENLYVNNYGTNTVSIFNTTSKQNIISLQIPDNQYEIKKITLGQDKNLYVTVDQHEIYQYDQNYKPTRLEISSRYLGKLSFDTLKASHIVNTMNPKHGTVIIYDDFSGQSYAKGKFTKGGKEDGLFEPLTTTFGMFISKLNFTWGEMIKSMETTQKTGFLFTPNDQNTIITSAHGQVKTERNDDTLQLKVGEFYIKYDQSEYYDKTKYKEPQIVAYLTNEFPTENCLNDAIELGDIRINAGENKGTISYTNPERYSTIVRTCVGEEYKIVNLNKYQHVVMYDKSSNSVLSVTPLRDYGIARVSLHSFFDWIQAEFIVQPNLYVLIMIVPIIFDYSRMLFKVFFFSFHQIFIRPKNELTNVLFNKKITILIPAHNEEYGIRESIEAALASTYPNKEVIVINDGSKDKTYDIANSFAEKGLIKLINRESASGSKATALNYGLNYATGDYILCMDGDTKLDKDALRNAAKYFDDENIVALSGNVRILKGDNGIENLLTKLQLYEYMIAIELGRRFTSVFQILLVISGAFGIFRKDAISGVHTFDKDTLTEDFDLTLKLRKTKGTIRFVGDSIAYTYCPNNWPTWVKQRNRWAYGQLQTLYKNMNIIKSKFPLRDKLAFIDMFLLDVGLAVLFPIGLTVLGIIAILMMMNDNLHILVYPLFFVMMIFLISEFIIFLLANSYPKKSRKLRLFYLAPVMTFFYRPYLRMVNLRGYLRVFFKKGASW